MNQDTLLTRKPGVEITPFGLKGFLEEPCGASPTAQPMTHRVASTEIFLATQARHIVKRTYQVGG